MAERIDTLHLSQAEMLAIVNSYRTLVREIVAANDAMASKLDEAEEILGDPKAVAMVSALLRPWSATLKELFAAHTATLERLIAPGRSDPPMH